MMNPNRRNSFLEYLIFGTAILPISGLLYFIVFQPMSFPITDDWYYIPWGYNQVKPGNISDLELVTGHQQIITKYTIWLFGFLPGLYPKYIGLLNCLFGIVGYFLLIISNLKYVKKQISAVCLSSILILTFSYKPFYMYATATALGPMQAIFCIGLYYFIKNSNNGVLSKLLLVVVIFLSPYTTGLGLIVPLAEISENIYRFFSKNYSLKRNIPLLTSAMAGIFIAYIYPLLTKNISPRAGLGEKNVLTGISDTLKDPLALIAYIFGLTGNVFVPSSRYDPILPIIFGALFLAFLIFFIRKPSYVEIKDILLNRNSTLAGVFFVALIIATRFSGQRNQIIHSSAPRYVVGYTVFLLGIIALVIKKITPNMIFDVIITAFAISALISGLKTGLEWQSIRSQQTSAVINCLEKYPTNSVNINPVCFDLAYKLRFENTSTETFSVELSNYLEISGLASAE